MEKVCPSCGADVLPEARFCRQCGAPLRPASSFESGNISPLAQTVPLAPHESRPTDGLPTGGSGASSQETSRIKLEEMEQLLRPASDQLAPTQNINNSTAAFVNVEGAGKLGLETAVYAAPQTSQLSAETLTGELGAQPAPSSQPLKRPRGKRLLPALLLSLFALALVAATVVFFVSRRQSRPSANQNSAPPVSQSEQPKGFETQLAEAESLLAAGDVGGATSRLRELVQREPTNAKAHRLLGEAFLRSGVRLEAIKEYRLATQHDPQDTASWRALASAQVAEGLYTDAVESYRRLIALTGEAGLDDNGWLEYADALRQAGYGEEARAAYNRVAANAPEDLARAARRHLSELPQPRPSPNASPSPSNAPEAERAGLSGNGANAQLNTQPVAQNTAQPVVSPTPSPKPSPTPAASQSAAQAEPDADYAQAQSILGGRDPKSLSRPELLRALELFQKASRSGTHRGEAQRNAERLGREFDRRRKQK